jgi:hypothetical protein
MSRRKVLKITPVLVTINIFLLLFIIGFYTFRLIKYYKLENGESDSNNTNLLVDKVLKDESYVDLTKGLVKNDDKTSYTYKGDVDNNYLIYSGNLYRILGIDNEKNIRAISENVITMMYSGLEKGYDDSYVNKWLNDTEKSKFTKDLYGFDLLTNSFRCEDKIDDMTKITCENLNMSNKVTILSLYDYYNAGGKSSFLNNGETYYLSTTDSSNETYFITETGEIAKNQVSTKIHGVRPVITLSSKTELLSGNGSKDNPYVVEKHDINELKDVYVGNYIELDGIKYRVIEKETDSVRVASTEALTKNNKLIETTFDSTSSKINVKTGLGLYLNKNVLNMLNNNENIVESSWNIGKLALDNLDYTALEDEKVTMKIGMLNISDNFIGDVKNVFTLTRGIESDLIINVIKENGTVFGDNITSKYNIRIAFNLKNDLKIKNGTGTLNNPFVLGE